MLLSRSPFPPLVHSSSCSSSTYIYWFNLWGFNIVGFYSGMCTSCERVCRVQHHRRRRHIGHGCCCSAYLNTAARATRRRTTTSHRYMNLLLAFRFFLQLFIAATFAHILTCLFVRSFICHQLHLKSTVAACNIDKYGGGKVMRKGKMLHILQPADVCITYTNVCISHISKYEQNCCFYRNHTHLSW